MKFSQMPYARPDLEALEAITAATVAKLEGARSADEAVAAFRERTVNRTILTGKVMELIRSEATVNITVD